MKEDTNTLAQPNPASGNVYLAVTRGTGAGQPAIRAVDRSEHVADRLAEGIRGVLHARRLLGIAAVPGIGEAQAAVVEAAYQQEREQSHGYDHDEKYHG